MQRTLTFRPASWTWRYVNRIGVVGQESDEQEPDESVAKVASSMVGWSKHTMIRPRRAASFPETPHHA
jgi:hypothetical protein